MDYEYLMEQPLYVNIEVNQSPSFVFNEIYCDQEEPNLLN